MSYPNFYAQCGWMKTAHTDVLAKAAAFWGPDEPLHLSMLHAPLDVAVLVQLFRAAVHERCMFRTEEAAAMHHGAIAYTAPPALKVPGLLQALCRAANRLVYVELDDAAVLAAAALLHLDLLCIHPFRDGNGRTARFLELWFIAQHRGGWAYRMQTERYYRERRLEYCNNLRAIGPSWDKLDPSKALPFLQMLPAAITHRLNP